jgi:hypothetical protein
VSETGHHRFIFICGLHRSGTSPLFRVLREHPEISGFRDTGVPEDEGQHLQTVFPPAQFYGGPGRFGFAKEAHLTEESALLTRENRQKLLQEWSRYWDLSKRYLIEKSPPNLIKTRFLQAAFPNCQFIVLLRHPIATSMATLKWASSGLESLLEHWVHCHSLFQQDRSHLCRVHVLKYEDLIRDTETELKNIYKFLNVEPHVFAPLNPAGNESYFALWQKLNDDPGGMEMSRRIISKYEDRIQFYGYSFRDFALATRPAVLLP